VVPRRHGVMARWRQNLFEALSRNAGRAVEYFALPHNAVIELGTACSCRTGLARIHNRAHARARSLPCGRQDTQGRALPFARCCGRCLADFEQAPRPTRSR
jgi:hypothetical protein